MSSIYVRFIQWEIVGLMKAKTGEDDDNIEILSVLPEDFI